MKFHVIFILATILCIVISSSVPLKTVPMCFKGGCSGQLCSDKPNMISTCEWRESYACYHTAKCELQADGKCGWTMTDELKKCLENN